MAIPRYIADLGIALTFKLVYTVQIPLEKMLRKLDFTIGWEAIMPSLNREGALFDQKIDFFLK